MTPTKNNSNNFNQNNTPENDQSALQSFIKEGIIVAGEASSAGTGALIGGLVGGIPGACIGGALTPVIASIFQHVADEFFTRILGKREKARVSAVFYYSIEKINQNIENGLKVREDFECPKNSIGRHFAEEILEGILLAAQRDHEEKKLPYYSNLIANLAFHPEIDRAQANLLIRIGRELSYQQLCLLRVLAQRTDYNLSERPAYEILSELGCNGIALFQELYDLNTRKIIGGEGFMGQSFLKPRTTGLSRIGETIYSLMELDKINYDDVLPIISLLRTESGEK